MTSILIPSLVFLMVLGSSLLVSPKFLVSLVPEYTRGELVTLQEYMRAEQISEDTYGTSTLFFLGDVMLGRHVETLLTRHGADYPYRAFGFLQEEPAYVVANFESALPRLHQKTPNFGFRFSVDQQYLPALRQAGVTHLGLANNHTLDFGQDDFGNLADVLSEADFSTFGRPYDISTSSVTVVTLGRTTIALLGVMAIDSAPERRAIDNLLALYRDTTDLQIAYVHWGSEYVTEPNASQIAFAETLIKTGIDLIIGHHPHVVQRIDMVSGVPVLYSLGNFIFDQYFSEAVQESLVLKVQSRAEGLQLAAIPMTSLTTQAQPRLMTAAEADDFYRKIAEFSDPALLSALRAGTFALAVPLASSTEVAIMSQ